ncbi:putative purine-cytosine permease protein [Phaeoacremonium minimum UCRPA7]|uniref:Putative purine-cytosine permease protein n=1 Tax=Phaeoacremonium minimum (strain UCR-PA7) TaxID=1286976 RepID=R8BH30_PHAM7|nr:putative purine-cytosine permease protein [Phaeoacremonium minimum UCRPA7]EON98547.1 putative purine-cytosine permease protein [Phaeoacremonium minimum UCRPA7]
MAAKKDLETGGGEKFTEPDTAVGYVGDENAVHKSEFVAGDSIYARLQRAAGKFGVEQRGIERVPSDERTDAGMSKIGTLWLSANMVVSSFAIGALAQPIFALGFVDTALTIIFINILGIIPVCFFSTFGPRFGLRQMVLSRFYFGYYGVKLIAIFNILACIGWSSVNVIVGAQLFNAINHDMPGWAGIIVIAISTLIICTFGYKIVHAYERWSWIPCLIIFLIVAGEFGHSGKFNSLLPLERGPTEAGSVLSFAASVYGFATGWCSYAADYTVYQPVDRSRRSVFAWTFAGLFLPLVFTELLGAAVMTAAATDETFSDAYFDSGIGGLLATVLVPPLGRFGEFCVVVLALSIIANNCPNIYSVGLTLQVLAKGTQRVPRFVWVFIGTGAYIAISIPGYDHFESWLENFMLVIGYWLAIYEGISLTEHFVFKRGFGGYHPEDYVNPSRLPPGFAAITAFGFGIMGAVLGMAQVWFTGPIGKLCGGDYGGDVGFELAFAFAAISYLALRTVEKSYFKR